MTSGELSNSSTGTVVFVCEHGAAKSVLAAAYLPQLARTEGHLVRALARGTHPDPELAPAAVAGLQADGVPVPDHAPQVPTETELASAAVVVTFGLNLGSLVPDHVAVYDWSDVPAVSDGYHAARDAIITHIVEILGRLPR